MPTSFNLRLLVGAFVLREDVQDLLDLYVRFCTAIYPSHNYNRPSAHIIFRSPHPKKAFASCGECARCIPHVRRPGVDAGKVWNDRRRHSCPAFFCIQV